MTETITEEQRKQNELFAKLNKRVGRAKMYIHLKFPFFGNLLLHLNLNTVDAATMGIPVAGVDARCRLYLNFKRVAELTEPQLRFVLMHEVLHPALQFFKRQETRNLLVFNVAHDFVVNQIIKDYIEEKTRYSLSAQEKAPIEILQNTLLSEKYRNWSAEAIYDDLMNTEGREKIGLEENDAYGGVGKDIIPSNDFSSKKREERQLQQQWITHLARAAQEEAKKNGRGALPLSLKKIIDEILNPKIAWQELLRRYISTNMTQPTETYMRVHKRSFPLGHQLPGLKKTEGEKVTVLWDTSGSMSDTETLIFSELIGLSNELNTGFRLITIDAEIHQDVMLEYGHEAIEYAEGGGGSDFNPAFDRLEEENSDTVVVAFTDGWIGIPPTFPSHLAGIIWVMVDSEVQFPYGEHIYIKREELKRK